ncbi:MAG: hypothetical protein ABSD46_09345 [Bacteroidota bacterium]
MNKTLIAWLVFIGSLTVEFLCDYSLRVLSGNKYLGGIPKSIFFTLEYVISMVFVWLLFKATNSIDSAWRRAFIIFAQIVAGFIVYVVMSLFYIMLSGIE